MVVSELEFGHQRAVALQLRVRGEQDQVLRERRLDERRDRVRGGDLTRERQHVVAQLAVVVRVALRQLADERVAQLSAFESNRIE